MRPHAKAPSPLVLVVSAPSGTGKTTLNRRLVADHPEIQISVSYTTRPRRPGELDGVHYHYVSQDVFQGLVASGGMLEYAQVFGTLYGTARAEIERIASLGKTPLLEIDVQGWLKARTLLTHSQSILILPPNVETLWQRLERRGTEDRAVRWRRLLTARDEIKVGPEYEHFVINRDLDQAYEELENLIISGVPCRLSRTEGIAHCQELLREFAEAAWLKDLRRELGKDGL